MADRRQWTAVQDGALPEADLCRETARGFSPYGPYALPEALWGLVEGEGG